MTLLAKRVRLPLSYLASNAYPSVDVALNIAGYSGSTQVASLLQAFESLNISVTLPGLKTNLLSTAAFEGMHALSVLLIVFFVLLSSFPANLYTLVFSSSYNRSCE
jgi:hypothetical protein